jgi:hypothetical protein
MKHERGDPGRLHGAAGALTLDECARHLELLGQGTRPEGCGEDDPLAWLLGKVLAAPMGTPEERNRAQGLVIRLERMRWRRDAPPADQR